MSADFTILGGYRTIQIYRKVSGVNWRPHEIVWAVCGNTLVDEADFPVLNQERWLTDKVGYVQRTISLKGKTLLIYMAREIMNLPRLAGRGSIEADHRNREIRDNTRNNLRLATSEESKRNQGPKANSTSRFKGVWKHERGFESRVRYQGDRLCLGTFKTDVEAALAFFYSTQLLDKDHFYYSPIPPDEMPTEARQEEIWQRVCKKIDEYYG